MTRTRVLVVDDVDLFRTGLSAALRAAGFDICGQAADAEGAVTAAEELLPDVVVLDILMPGLSGLEVVEKILAVSPSSRVILLTASESVEDLLEGIRAGARGYLVKDTAFEGLAEAIREVVRGGAAVSARMGGKLFDILRRHLRHQDIAGDREPCLTGAGGGDPAPRGGRGDLAGDRAGALHLREHRQEPHPQHPRQARPALAQRGRALRRAREPDRVVAMDPAADLAVDPGCPFPGPEGWARAPRSSRSTRPWCSGWPPSSPTVAPPDAGVAVLRDLLRIETRRPRFHRLLRVWVGKLTAAVRVGDLARAEAWMRGLVIAPTYPDEFADLVAEALDEVSEPQVLDDLVVHLAAADPPGTGAGLVAAWGERLARYLVQGMVVEEPPVNRRFLVEFLSWVGRDDVRLLAAFVADSRWFVVRNVAIALGRTGRPQAVPPLESLLDHPDHRVRVEALRGLFVLKRGEAVGSLVAALADPEPRVRHAAVSLLHASPSRRGGRRPGRTAGDPSSGRGRSPAAGGPDCRTDRPCRAGRPGTARRAAPGHGGAGRVVREAARQALGGRDDERTRGPRLPAGPVPCRPEPAAAPADALRR